MPKVIVGMSGGVDSAVAACLLQRAGYEVIGVTLRTWASADGQENRCCEIDAARRTAQVLGIRYVPLNCLSAFETHVVRPFIADYLHGRTPNPCILCNRDVKWDKLLYMAKVLEADFVATGHYASVVRLPSGRYSVRRAKYAGKDQTYMLYALTQEQLAATLMPLGELSKNEVRSIARQAGLPVADKPDSQEICFVTDGGYADFIENNAETALPGKGSFVDEEGAVLGGHRGIIHYTVGQRRGLGLALGCPAYVKQIRAERNEIVIGPEQSLYSSRVLCRDVRFMSIPGLSAGEELPCSVKIRYRHTAQSARIGLLGPDLLEIVFDEPVRAAAPGQSAVFYDGAGCVIGGGVIAQTA